MNAPVWNGIRSPYLCTSNQAGIQAYTDALRASVGSGDPDEHTSPSWVWGFVLLDTNPSWVWGRLAAHNNPYTDLTADQTPIAVPFDGSNPGRIGSRLPLSDYLTGPAPNVGDDLLVPP